MNGSALSTSPDTATITRAGITTVRRWNNRYFDVLEVFFRNSANYWRFTLSEDGTNNVASLGLGTDASPVKLSIPPSINMNVPCTLTLYGFPYIGADVTCVATLAVGG